MRISCLLRDGPAYLVSLLWVVTEVLHVANVASDTQQAHSPFLLVSRACRLCFLCAAAAPSLELCCRTYLPTPWWALSSLTCSLRWESVPCLSPAPSSVATWCGLLVHVQWRSRSEKGAQEKGYSREQGRKRREKWSWEMGLHCQGNRGDSGSADTGEDLHVVQAGGASEETGQWAAGPDPLHGHSAIRRLWVPAVLQAGGEIM